MLSIVTVMQIVYLINLITLFLFVSPITAHSKTSSFFNISFSIS
ncbi:exported protein of unknown function [Xenorhabdus doucetiae]|uniref:Uncharacterized protein n=1 Tax=Xenorhabdus doucetiae TaxID=351671 RepID=A0A068QW93_9GAMM|nr:exported protein of unknown function [Xenorhabdus doucetiae]